MTTSQFVQRAQKRRKKERDGRGPCQSAVPALSLAVAAVLPLPHFGQNLPLSVTTFSQRFNIEYEYQYHFSGWALNKHN